MDLDTQKMELKKTIIMLLLFLTYSCDKHSNSLRVDSKDVSKIINFTLTETKDGMPTWKIFAKEAEIDEKNNKITIFDGSIKFYKKDDYVSIMIFKQAIMNTITNDIFFIGENIVNTVEKEKIITYDIKYISSINKAFSDKEIKVYRLNNLITGKGFETEDGFKTINIKETIIVPQN